MRISQKEDLKLRLGNLFLAIWLATVPTAITYGVFGLYGINICRTLSNNVEVSKKYEIKSLCQQATWETTQNYILLIGFFITIPTWYWFYMNMKIKKVGASKEVYDEHN